MKERYKIQQIRNGEVVREFVAKYAWSGPIDNKDAAAEYARWFKFHYGLSADTYRAVFDL